MKTRRFTVLFWLCLIAGVVQALAVAWIIVWVIRNPEAIGAWFGRLTGGGA